MALPLSTPPETGLSNGFGACVAVAVGGGGSSSNLTAALSALPDMFSALPEAATLVLTSEPPLGKGGAAADLLVANAGAPEGLFAGVVAADVTAEVGADVA